MFFVQKFLQFNMLGKYFPHNDSNKNFKVTLNTICTGYLRKDKVRVQKMYLEKLLNALLVS